MKKSILLLALLITAFACKDKQAGSEAAQEEETTTEETPMKETTNEPEWVVLFDGTSMDEWRGYGMDEMPAEWAIEEDALAFTPGEEGGKNIITRETYRNFILSLEWKISEAGNSGIFWGVYEDEQFPEAYETGAEIQVLDNTSHPDAKVANGTHTAGSLYDMIAPPQDVTKPVGEWNECVLTVDYDKNIGSVQLNGIRLFDFPVKGEQWDNMVANSKFATWPGFAKYEEGHIGLQDHSDKVWYRNIKIQRLD